METDWKRHGPVQVLTIVGASIFAFALFYVAARLIGNHSPGPVEAGIIGAAVMFLTLLFRVRQHRT